MNRRLFFIISFSLLLTLSVGIAESTEPISEVVHQQGISIQMNVRAGFDGYCRSNIPIPLTVDIFNGSEREFDGNIRIDTVRWIPPSRYFTKVHLEREEKKQFLLYVFETGTRELNVVLENNNGQPVIRKSVAISDASIFRDVLMLVVSENPDDFNFIHKVNVSDYRRFSAAPPMVDPGLNIVYTLSTIIVTRKIIPQMSRDIISWEDLSVVYFDFASYAGLDDNLRKNLKTWVNLGGELVLYPSERNLDESETDRINSDEFLPINLKEKFEIRKASNPETSLLESAIQKGIESKFDSVNAVYSIDELPSPVMTSVARGTGGITVMNFRPDDINMERLDDWIDILFQAGLLTPYPYYSLELGNFQGIVSGRIIRGSHIPTGEKEFTSGLTNSVLKSFVTIIIPVLVIAGLGVLMFLSGKRKLYFRIVLPVLVLAFLFIPAIDKEVIRSALTGELPSASKILNMLRHSKGYMFKPRNYEGFHILNFIDGKTDPPLYCGFMVEKKYPQTGTIKLMCDDGFTFYDEMISGFGSKTPKLVVCNDDPGWVKSLEATPETFRFFTGQSVLDNIGGFEGTIEIGEDGEVHYTITNNTNLNLSNCEITRYSKEGIIMDNPVLFPDIPANQTVSGTISSEGYDPTADNESLLAFSDSLGDGILSSISRRELMYGLEAMIKGLAYKPSRWAEVYQGEIQFSAWTSDLRRNPSVNDSKLIGPEITLVVAKLKSTVPEDKRMFELSLESLVPGETFPGNTSGEPLS